MTRTGLWERGRHMRWTRVPVTAGDTTEFLSRFRDDDDYEGMYAILVARRLPVVPAGVNIRNRAVRRARGGAAHARCCGLCVSAV